MDLPSLITDAGWKIVRHLGRQLVRTQYEEEIGLITIKHPVLVHLEIFRKHTDPEVRYQHLKIAHDMLWPSTVWHEWTERRFRTHCEGYNYITLAAGASASKSYDVAKYAVLFWYAAPTERNVTIASVTMSSLMTRVWGYLTAHIKEMKIPLPYKYYRSTPPKILFEDQVVGKNKIDDDTLHGIFAVTAKVGDDDQAVATWIGKHPKDKILLVLDECTDMPMSILNALPNLNSHPAKFELIGIGNSSSVHDLHGLLSTPRGGWDTVSPDLISWETTQKNGICLYFSPYTSPAITDPDPKRRAILEVFLMGADNLLAKEEELGKDSEQFHRWVLGFWKSRDTDQTTVSQKFLADKDYDPTGVSEWSGYYPLTRVAGLDPAFSTHGDKCLLRIATIGHCFDTKVRIDLGHGNFTHQIKLSAIIDSSIEKQIGEEVVRILMLYKIPLDLLAIDVTGQGRAIGEVIKLVNEKKGFPLGFGNPLKIYSMSPHNVNKRKTSAPDIVPLNSHILWNTIREYIEQGRVCGLDDLTAYQMRNRLIVSTVTNGRRIDRLENKQEYKRRMAAIGNPHSPDEADAAALCFQVMRQRVAVEPTTTWPIPLRTVKDKGDEKMYLHLVETGEIQPIAPQSGGVLHVPADFSGGLDTYLSHRKPF